MHIDSTYIIFILKLKTLKTLFRINLIFFVIERNISSTFKKYPSIEMQMLRMDLWTQDGEGEGGMNWKRGVAIYTAPCVKQIASGKLLYHTRRSACFSVDLEGWYGWEGGTLKRERIYVYI